MHSLPDILGTPQVVESHYVLTPWVVIRIKGQDCKPTLQLLSNAVVSGLRTLLETVRDRGGGFWDLHKARPVPFPLFHTPMMERRYNKFLGRFMWISKEMIISFRGMQEVATLHAWRSCP